MKGAEAKAEITKKLLETFEGSFLYNGGKEIRIPFNEAEAGDVQIKITLTCAKENVMNPDMGTVDNIKPIKMVIGVDVAEIPSSATTEITDEEKQKVKDLLDSLNF